MKVVIVILSFAFICSCNSVEKFVDKNEFEKADNYCNSFKNEKKIECYTTLANACLKTNSVMAAEYFEKAGNKNELKKLADFYVNKEMYDMASELYKKSGDIDKSAYFDIKVKDNATVISILKSNLKTKKDFSYNLLSVYNISLENNQSIQKFDNLLKKIFLSIHDKEFFYKEYIALLVNLYERDAEDKKLAILVKSSVYYINKLDKIKLDNLLTDAPYEYQNYDGFGRLSVGLLLNKYGVLVAQKRYKFSQINENQINEIEYFDIKKNRTIFKILYAYDQVIQSTVKYLCLDKVGNIIYNKKGQPMTIKLKEQMSNVEECKGVW